ncbi:MAG: zinc ABC transporter substrate-binding protein, partial [Bifidobacteriaceae bacterium]|nr:zinc ABC transporter substrate-binding protein [Bifidobacteriaceae bacterium]
SIISSTNIEAHNYEPTANNIIEFNNNQLIVINGAGYDDWAKKAAEQVKSKTLIDVGEINNVKSGNNPHLFYSLKYIKTAINIISNKLISLNPDLKNFFSEQTKSVEKEYNYLTEKIQQTSDKYTSNNSKKRKVVVTETIADYLLNDLKFDNITPLGYLQSVSNEGEPTAEDLNSFRKLLNSKTPNLFILNTQEENNTTEQLSSAAQNNNIKIIKITESMPEKYTSLNQWLESVIEQIVD